MRRVNETTTDIYSLLGEILAGMPRLEDAACREDPNPFDPAGRDEAPEDVARRHDLAVSICQACPALADCGEWRRTTSPRNRPAGVLAGTRPTAAGRPREDVA